MFRESIDEMLERIESAELVASDLADCRPHGLSVVRIADYTVVRDDHTSWIAETEQYAETAEIVISEILDGTIIGNGRELLARAYDRLCTLCEAVCETDAEKLAVALECNSAELLQIYAELGLADEPLPAMIRVLKDQGEIYSGNEPVYMALAWLEAGFDADSADQWMDAGFWAPEQACDCRDAGLTPEMATEAAESLVARNGEDAYTSGDPIYSACNYDTDVHKLIEEARRLV